MHACTFIRNICARSPMHAHILSMNVCACAHMIICACRDVCACDQTIFCARGTYTCTYELFPARDYASILARMSMCLCVHAQDFASICACAPVSICARSGCFLCLSVVLFSIPMYHHHHKNIFFGYEQAIIQKYTYM